MDVSLSRPVLKVAAIVMVVFWSVGYSNTAHAQRRGLVAGAIVGVIAGAIIAHQASQAAHARPHGSYGRRSSRHASGAKSFRGMASHGTEIETKRVSDPFAGVKPSGIIEVRKD